MLRARLIALALVTTLVPVAAIAAPAHPELLKRSPLLARNQKARRVSIVMGTFDPFHEDHFALARLGRAEGADEVLLVPGWNPSHKENVTPIEHRMQMIEARIARARGVNLYKADASQYLRHGQDAFVEHVKALYGTDDVTIHIGQDAFEEGVRKYGLSPNIAYRYRVVPRGDGPPPAIPPGLEGKVTIAPRGATGAHSSTEVRARIKAGRSLQGIVHPAVERHIRMHHLYE